MKKILILIFIVLISIIMLVVSIFVNKGEEINIGDYLNQVAFKNKIPKVILGSDASIGIENGSYRYMILYSKAEDKIIITVSENLETDDTMYIYSWKNNAKLPSGQVLYKGWNIANTRTMQIEKIEKLPFEAISGEVKYTDGNTKIISNFLSKK